MAEIKHAPYPWVARPAHSGIWDVFDGDSRDVVTVFGSHAKYHAGLISAAPDLLEALKDARYALYGTGPGNPKIDAAIAKAEGRGHD